MPIPILSQESPDLAIVDWCLIPTEEVSIATDVIEITWTWKSLGIPVAYAILAWNPLKEKASKRSIAGSSCTQEREILKKFVETFHISQSLLPTGGVMCYCCLTKLKKWDKMKIEIHAF